MSQSELMNVSALDIVALVSLPTSRPRDAGRVAQFRTYSFTIADSLLLELSRLTDVEGVQPYIAMLAGFYALLYRYTGQTTLAVRMSESVIGTPASGGTFSAPADCLTMSLDLSGDIPFTQLLHRVDSAVRQARNSHNSCGEHITLLANDTETVNQPSRFDALLRRESQTARELVDDASTPSTTSRTDTVLRLSPSASGRGVAATWEYRGDLFERAMMRSLSRHYMQVLKSAALDSARSLHDLALLTGGERRRQLSVWNKTQTNYSTDRCLHHLFESQAEQSPNALALTCNGVVWTYQDLNRRANQIARCLSISGLRPGNLVGVHMQRSPEMIAALIAILKAGGAYVPLDVGLPEARLHWLLRELEITHLLTDESRLAVIDALDPLPALQHLICPSRDDDEATAQNTSAARHRITTGRELDRFPSENVANAVPPESLAYVIFTSGSTGVPKGVMVAHRPVINLIEWVNTTFRVGPSDRVLFVTALSFDLSVYDIFGLLAAGGSIHIVPDSDLRDPDRLIDLLETEPITFWDSAPAALQQLVPLLATRGSRKGHNALRLVFLSGDWIPLQLPSQVRHAFPRAEIVALGGATEATVWSNYHRVSKVHANWVSIPYGRPIQNARYYILDHRLHPCPIGVTGDLYIGGECLSAGYIHQPALTAERFLPDPYGGTPGARMYRTGDLTRYWADGTIEFLGRSDHQVKIRGYRIELGEIEVVMGRHPKIRDVVTLAREDVPAQKRLVAYIVPVSAESPPAIGELQAYARSYLPPYMVPSAIVLLESLPLTSNGKIDRRALPQPARGESSNSPHTTEEAAIARIWSEILGVTEVAIDEDFFTLGGNSLSATQVIARLRDVLQVEIPLSHLFESPTIAGLAQRIAQAATRESHVTLPPIVRTARDREIPLALPQERIWFLQHLDPTNLAYHFQATIHFDGALDVGMLKRSLSEIVRRHEILRTTFPLVDGQPRQVFHPPWPVEIPIVEVAGSSDHDRKARIQDLIDAAVRHPFDPERLPLLRWLLIRLGTDEHILVHMEHHLIHDGWSFNTFIGEMITLYDYFARNLPSPLPELPVQYADFAVWQRQWLDGSVMETQLAYWKEQLADLAPEIALPTDYPRPPQQSFRGDTLRMELPPDLCEKLRLLGRNEGATLFMVMLAALFALLHRYSGQSDIAVGVGIANRRRREVEALIGMVINTVVIRADLPPSAPFLSLLSRVRNLTLEAYANQDAPFDRVVQAVRPERHASHNPLFQVILGFHDAPLPDLHLPGLVVRLHEGISNGSAKFDLNIIAIPRVDGQQSDVREGGPSGITLLWEYNADLFKPGTISRMAANFRTILEGITATPAQRISELPVISDGERTWITQGWNNNQRDFPAEVNVHRLFEHQAERTPAAVAVRLGSDMLTYQQLDQRANQLAWYLRELGVHREALVGICMERTPQLVTAMLGILKAQGTYVPLDPADPPDRHALILSDAQPTFVLTQRSLLAQIPSSDTFLICIEDIETTLSALPAKRLGGEGSALDLAYVMYTSGSTGQPKGIGIPHRAISRLVCNTDYIDIKPTDCVAQASNAAFDAATFEIWGALLHGAQLVIIPRDVVLAPDEFSNSLQKYRITILFLTTALFNQLARMSPDVFQSLRYLMFGGEAVDQRCVRAVLNASHPLNLVHVYGPTEATTFATWYPVKVVTEEETTIPIGRPIANTQVFLLDRHMELVPIGVPGEIYIGGPGIARGYLGRSGLTAQSFVPHPFSRIPGERMYRTGDLARYRPDGSIEFIGRFDDQVKIRGFRIEPAEVEVALKMHPAVKEAAVLVRADLQSGEKRLIAYFVPLQETPSLSDLRDYLNAKLPRYMMPARLVPLSEFPLTANGKVDHHALPDPGVPEAPPASMDDAPTTDLERIIAEIWAEVLGVGHVGPQDNFFDIGGSSLQLIQVYSALRTSQRGNVSMVDLFQYPTIRALARFFAAGDAGGQPDTATRDRASTRLAALSQQRARRDRMHGGTDAGEISERSGV